MVERGLLDLMLARLSELSQKEKILLCESLNTEQDLIQKSKADIEAVIGHELAVFWDIDLIRMLAECDAAAARLSGINWVSWNSPAYPPLLREIYDPPVLLFFRGLLPNPESPLAAVVGTRKPSPQAAAQAFEIAKGLARGGISVVSGLAFGIDAMAHRGNIEGGAPTVAVLGSGVDEVYPSSNRPLARRILETGGALLSEYPPGAVPHKWSFPARNRIIAGLARGVVIVEAPQRSGALITARFAVDYNRELWIASAGTGEGRSVGRFDRRGTVKLAGEGAGIIYSAADILQAWNHETALASSLAQSVGNTLGITHGITESVTNSVTESITESIAL
ncbi:MAG: DNA-processing protein DprA [Treponema sp.]|jgi:DNA processing protein|nr:DNA-processing protein DprA [Treponema sp.]